MPRPGCRREAEAHFMDKVGLVPEVGSSFPATLKEVFNWLIKYNMKSASTVPICSGPLNYFIIKSQLDKWVTIYLEI